MLTHVANVVVRALLAPVCAACRAVLDRPLDGPICRTCWQAIPHLVPPWCDWCGDSLPPAVRLVPLCDRCLQSPPSFDIARSAGRHDGSLRELIHAFKFEGRRMLAPSLAKLMVQSGATLLARADAVVPVPLHPWRSMQRGFNQADDLATHLGLPVWRVLRRVRAGPPQASRSADARATAVQAAFAARRWIIAVPGGGPSRLKGATVVLIDDVMTTGATAEACTRALLDAGAAAVRVLTVARAVAGRPAQQRLRQRRPAGGDQ